ncbi:glycosyltransferase family 2 protein [Pantoea allii]|uniref:Glycosyltransferase family 2 protein n=1 Tax=Pantoea allii TaxID=574096 RepID=A0ABS6V8S5_9GAMM|nr:glycosyltransferase family A protein [Pantoea allii]MBW1212673.1 glycosyltransferase family 2 protein [Pantoea allii]MBW1255689.1 glycosyltransferase family 2 protein [Pantoea allii]MBW1264766.1 glycosyltransferase family 2 protein [Pantoea allii]MBW1286883.1 glycosyltransferase family 2 protein [Pantoea allii]
MTLTHPYYILSPDYRESSGGIQVLHKLCHRINSEGGEAYMVGCQLTNPRWNTPLLDEASYARHVNENCPGIAVYPEIQSGNPLQAEVVVRYMLNHEALLNGNKMDEGVEDFIFWYSSQLIVNEINVDFLTLVGPDKELFFDDGREKTLNLLYLNRVPESAINFSELPDDIEIISIQNPLPLDELANKLRQAKVFYTYEWSGTCNLAAMCGAPVVAKIAKGYEKLAIGNAAIVDMGGGGVAWADDSNSLEKARSELYKVHLHIKKFDDEFIAQLNVFFEKTQRRAQEKSALRIYDEVSWLKNIHQHYNDSQISQDLISQKINFLVIVDDNAEWKGPDNKSLGLNKLLNIDVGFVNAQNEFSGKLEDYFAFPDATTFIMHDTDMLHTNMFLSALSVFNECVAEIGMFDKSYRFPSGENAPFFSPGINPDLILQMPGLMGKHFLLRNGKLLERFLEPGTIFADAELRFLSVLIRLNLTSSMIHIPLAIVCAQTNSVEVTESNLAMIKKHYHESGSKNFIVVKNNFATVKMMDEQCCVDKYTIIVYGYNNLDSLQKTILSCLETLDGIDYQFIVIHEDKTYPECDLWLNNLIEVDSARFKIHKSKNDIAISEKINLVVSECETEHFLLVSAGVIFCNNGWPRTMLKHLKRDTIAAVGGKLTLENNLIYSAGQEIIPHVGIYNQGYGEALSAQGPWMKLIVDRNVSSLNAACILFKTRSFIMAGKLDARFQLLQSAVSHLLMCFCQHGLFNVVAHEAVMTYEGNDIAKVIHLPHQDSALIDETFFLAEGVDPFACKAYNFHDDHYRLEKNLSLYPLRLHRKGVVYLDTVNNTETQLRGDTLSRAFSSQGINGFASVSNGLTANEIASLGACYFIYNDIMAPELIKHLSLKKQKQAGFVILDATVFYDYSKHNLLNLKEIICKLDMVIVRNIEAEQFFSTMNENVINIPDDVVIESLLTEKTIHNKPRVALALHSLRESDWRFLLPVIQHYSERIDWIIYGECPAELKPNIKEYHRKVVKKDFFGTLLHLNADLALAPLERGNFNRHKGAFDVLAWQALGVPCFASDVMQYDSLTGIKVIKNKASEWKYALQKYLEQADILKSEAMIFNQE